MISRFERRSGRSLWPHLMRLRQMLPPLATGRPTLAVRRVVFAVAIMTLALMAWLSYRWLWQPAWARSLPPLVGEMLNLGEAAGAFTVCLLWTGVLWQAWQRQRPVGVMPRVASPVPAELVELHPRAFEQYVADLFRHKGYHVFHRGRPGDLGVDLELMASDGRRAIVQCKRYQNTVGSEIVRELYGTLIHEGVDHAFLVTTAEISPAAEEWAQDKPITLIDGAMLGRIAHKLSL